MVAVRQGIEYFEKMHKKRVCMVGHGGWDKNDGKIVVPAGCTISYYIHHGQSLGNRLGNFVEGFTGTGIIPNRSMWPRQATPHITIDCTIQVVWRSITTRLPDFGTI